MENPKVFFSYSRADSEFVLKLAKDLRSAGVNLWIDQLDIAAGDRWDKAVEDALAAAPCLLVVLSPASVESHNVMDEVSLAFDERKKIVPVLAHACTIPFRLRRLQHVDFTVDYDRGLEGVLKALNLRPSAGVQTARDGSDGAAVRSAPRMEPATSRPQNVSTGAPTRKYIYAAGAALVLVAMAGGISFVLVPQYLDQSKISGSPGREAPTAANAPASPSKGLVENSPATLDEGSAAVPPPTVGPPPLLPPAPDAAQVAKLLPVPDEPVAALSPPFPDAKRQSMLPPPPSQPAQPINGRWDVAMSCRDGSAVNEYGAVFTRGTYARAFKDESVSS